MAQKIFTYENLVKYHGKIKEYINDADAKSIKACTLDGNKLKLYKVIPTEEGATADIEIELPQTDLTAINKAIADINNKTTGILAQSKGYTDTKVSELANGAVKTNTDAIAVLNGADTVEGSVAKAVKDLKATLDTDVANAKKAGTDAQADVDALETKVGDISTLSTINKDNIVSAINEVKAAIAEGGEAGAVTIDTTTTTEGALKSYTINQGGKKVGTIDIPKDLVVTSGTVVVDPEGQSAGTYIKLVIANQEEPIYINVGTLVDLYTAKADATQIQLTVDNSTREISAVIVANSVGTTELKDNAITTVKIADANVTLAKLATDVKESIADAKKAGTDAASAVTELTSTVTTNTSNIAKNTANIATLQEKVGEGIEAITEDEINALFA